MVTGQDPRQRGAVLVVVLVFAALVAGLAASAMRSSLSGVRAAAVFADAMRADELGRGAGDILADHLARADPGAQRGGRLEVRLPEADIVIDYLSESARVDVNLAPVGLISALLGAAGGDPAEVSAIGDRIMRFRGAALDKAKAASTAGKPQGASAALASAVNAIGPARAPSRPPLAIRDLAEVERAWGLPAELAPRVLPSLTVLNGKAQVDPVLADRLVLSALVGSDERVDDYLGRRSQGFVNKDSALELLPVPARASVTFDDSPAVRAVARVRVAHGFERRYEMILEPPPPPASVRVVVSWRKLL